MTGQPNPPAACGERGSITVLTALTGLAVLLLAGLVIDGAGRLRATARAHRIAAEAARAAVQAADTRGPTLTLDPPAAAQAARAHLTAAGVTGTIATTGARTVTVVVTVHGRDLILGLIGAADYTRTGQASATLTAGVTTPAAGPDPGR